MTGAATLALETPRGRLEAEARSVNHRFLKTTVRAQGPLPAATALAEEIVGRRLTRGHVSVHLHLRPSTGVAEAPRIHDAAFAAAATRLAALAEAHGLGAVSVRDVLTVPGVLSEARVTEDDETLLPFLRAALEGVIDGLAQSRAREGELLAAELERLFVVIAEATTAIAARADEIPTAFQARLRKRLDDLLRPSGVEPDSAQLARECASLAEKSDVREEVARLEAHVVHARELLATGGAVGRRLDFLVQELHREANTIASKSSDLTLARVVIDLRGSIERLREQVQNLE